MAEGQEQPQFLFLVALGIRQTALDSSTLPRPSRVLMWRESSLKPCASLGASRVSEAGPHPQWVAVSGSALR